MKTIHIVIILVLVIAIGVVISTLTDSSTYSNFTVAAEHPGKEYHVIGTLSPDKPLGYDAKNNPNEFSFFMCDENGLEKQVIYHNAKPQDFEKSEKVVLIGSMKGEVFEAKSLLLKCPSKYNDQNKPEQFGNKRFGSGT